MHTTVGVSPDVWGLPPHNAPAFVGCGGVITTPQVGKLSRLLEARPQACTRTYLPHFMSALSYLGSYRAVL